MVLTFDSLTIILVLLIFVIMYRIYVTSDIFQLKCIVSDVDGKKYCVRGKKLRMRQID